MKEIHLICNAHIDPIWQWDWQEGASAVLSTFASAVKLSSEYDYIFCHNEVTVYKYVEEYAPRLFEKIKELVKIGKWHIMGGWYLQPDCNLPSGESIVRQIKLGNKYFFEKFGKKPTVATNFDPFGHSVGLVQILKKCGYSGYLFMRPYKSEVNLPAEQFVWKGLDGSCIKAVRAESYSTTLGSAVKEITERVGRDKFDISCVLWGVGNHGGGPSRKDLSDIKRLMQSNNGYIHSTPEAFFNKINPTAIFDKSLRISMPGCYSSMHKIKKKHVQLENELLYAEKIMSVAYFGGYSKDYDENALTSATEDLLNAEFHDVLPGTCIRSGEENGLSLLNHGLLEVERLKTKAFFNLLKGQKPAKNGEYPIIVFNPYPYVLNCNVECEFSLEDQNWDFEKVSNIKLLDENGNPVKMQLIKEESNINLDWRKKIIFEAELQPLKLNRYSVYIEYSKVEEKEVNANFIYEDKRKYVEIDKETGLVKSFILEGKEYVKEGFELYSFDDNADPWAMDVKQLERVGVNGKPFVFLKNPNGVFEEMKSIQIVEDGDIYLGIEAFFEKENSKARILYKIYKNQDYVDIDVDVFLLDVNKAVKLKIPIMSNGELFGQTCFGTETLFKDARENTSQRFIGVDCGEKCFAIFNDGVYGSHFEDNSIYLTLLRGVTYCAHPISDRQLIPSDRFVKKVDQGENNFSFRIGVYEKGELETKSQEFIQKPYALNAFPIENEEFFEKPFNLSIENDHISLVAMKKQGGKENVILRLFNNSNQIVMTKIAFNGIVKELVFGEYEVKTVIYHSAEFYEETTDMLI